ncbi:heat shock factor protein isoform X2 [Malaya genurostris]|uniref:heat shock factor protein isoform X2 n=1 Tax=Malaya genurostris TaxID=325434 RepID=UPI0026F3ACDD|nr:heat shock factor protein isoform X2 [Malaya genurostris]
MHTFSETGTGVPAFLAKLWRLVEDPETNDLISWSTDGRSFIIQNQAQFAKELLPLNYKHNNMASFIRQLNMYGFHKITSIDNGGLRFDKDEMEFTHPCFQKDHPYLLEHIKRKIATSKQQQQHQDEKGGLKVEAVNRVLSEIKNMRGRQDTLDSRFSTMKQENEALWREVAILRQKHLKQQQIVNKLIQFLVTIVQPSRSGLGTMGAGNKRRIQLMINDAPQSKVKKTCNNEGATIQELGEALEEVAYENEQDLLLPDKGENGKLTSIGSIDKEKVHSSNKLARASDVPEVTSPISITQQSPYHTTNINDNIEEVLSPEPTFGTQQRSTGIKQERTDSATILTDNIIQLMDGEVDYGQDAVEYDGEGYLVDHVDEINSNNISGYDDTDMLNTPLVIKEMQKEHLLNKQQQNQLLIRQQQHQPQQQQPKSIGKGQSLLKMKKNGLNSKSQKSLLDNSKLLQPDEPGANNAINVLTRGGKKLATSGKQMSPENNVDAVAGSSGTGTNLVVNANPSSSPASYGVNDFIINEVPADLFDDNSQMEKESPMLGAFNFESGFYNPDININEMKGRQVVAQQQQEQNDQGDVDNQLNNIERNSDENDETSNARTLTRFVSNDFDVNRLQSLAEYGQQIDAVQTDLESLKDILKGEGYQLDANTLLGLFNGNDDIVGYEFPMNLPDMNDTQKKNDDGTMAVASVNGAGGSTGNGSSNLAANQLIAYKTIPESTTTGDYIDLNELLELENGNDEDNSIMI